jgi:undecaprenyl-phosphate 4-deoxy-4-formamido-L-arabinose transferase
VTSVEVVGPAPHEISAVVPVYQGERTLPALVGKLLELTNEFVTPDGHRARLTEVLLVYDHGPDDSASVIRDLEQRHDAVRAVWLSRNYGQHAATLAGLASTGGDWLVTLDEDGQHDPAAIASMLDTAMRERATVVYGKPVNPPPHGALRNRASQRSKWFVERLLSTPGASDYNSYRFILGEVGRSVAAYAGTGVYLDVALAWVADSVATCPITLTGDELRPSGYSFRALMSHFWRMVLTSGTRGLRLVSLLGLLFAAIGLGVATSLVVERLTVNHIGARGWTSTMVVVLVSTGAILFSLGIVAEYVGVAVKMAMGKPLYVIVRDPEEGPLGREPVS